MAKRLTQLAFKKYYSFFINQLKNPVVLRKLPEKISLGFLPYFTYLTQPLFTQIKCEAKISVEDDLLRACTEGETAIIDLMNELRSLVLETSKEYRKLLEKQIEITQRAVVAGPAAYDELPQYRCLSDELYNELNEYTILLKTIGEVAYNQTLISSVMKNDQKNEKNLDFILKKYQELEVVLLQQFEENKRLELELLQNKLTSIEYNKM